VPHRIVSAALQFAAGIVTALVAVTLMPPAIRNGPYVLAVLAFFAGDVLYIGGLSLYALMSLALN
jgi:hypothetical protein